MNSSDFTRHIKDAVKNYCYCYDDFLREYQTLTDDLQAISYTDMPKNPRDWTKGDSTFNVAARRVELKAHLDRIKDAIQNNCPSDMFTHMFCYMTQRDCPMSWILTHEIDGVWMTYSESSFFQYRRQCIKAIAKSLGWII